MALVLNFTIFNTHLVKKNYFSEKTTSKEKYTTIKVTKLNFRRLYSTFFKLKPNKIYFNAEKCKIYILNENKNKTGIYRWVNLINNNSYIGSSIDLKERFTSYFNLNHLKNNNSMSICLALIKYGYSNFSLEILEYCSPKERFNREFYYISMCNPEYNRLKIINTMPSRVSSIHSEETKSKISINNPNRLEIVVKDVLTSLETRFDSINKAEKALGLARGQISQYFNKNQIKPLRKRYFLRKETENLRWKSEEAYTIPENIKSYTSSIKIEVLNLKANTLTTYSSIRETARRLNIAHSTVSKYIKSNKKYLNQYIFKKKDN